MQAAVHANLFPSFGNSSSHVSTAISPMASVMNAFDEGGILSKYAYPTPPKPEGIPFPSLYNFFLNPLTPFLFGVTYFILAKTASYLQNGKNRMQGKRWNVVIVLHNIILAVYSGWTFVMTAPTVLGSFVTAYQHGGVSSLTHVFCDSDAAIWNNTAFPMVCYIFYLSKMYEVLDTVIILAKGKKVGMLQSYHHTGAIWTMYAGYRTMSMPIWIFCVFNSAIHTLMYCYYAFTAMKLPFPQFLKKSLTKLQITQFLVGGSLATSYLFIRIPANALPKASSYLSSFASTKTGSSSLPLSSSTLFLRNAAAVRDLTINTERNGTMCVVNPAQRAAVWLNVAYLVPLTYLFISFFVDSYKKGQARSAKAKKEKAQSVIADAAAKVKAE